jgi:hypothetical protein
MSAYTMSRPALWIFPPRSVLLNVHSSPTPFRISYCVANVHFSRHENAGIRTCSEESGLCAQRDTAPGSDVHKILYSIKK